MQSSTKINGKWNVNKKGKNVSNYGQVQLASCCYSDQIGNWKRWFLKEDQENTGVHLIKFSEQG